MIAPDRSLRAAARTSLLLSLAALAAPLNGQSLAGQLAEGLRQRDSTRQLSLAKSAPDAQLNGIVPRAFVAASNAESKVTISSGAYLFGSSSNMTLKLAAEAPLKKDEEEKTLTDFKRLGNGTTASLSLQGSWWNADLPRPSAVVEWCVKAKRDSALATKLAGLDCENFNRDASVRGVALRRNMIAEHVASSEPILYELTFRLGRSVRKYLDSATYALKNLDRTDWSGGVNLGTYVTSLGGLHATLLTGGVRYQVEDKDKDPAQICTPTAIAGALQCRTAPLGAPSRGSGTIASIGLRSFLIARWGVAPLAEYRPSDRVLTLELPIWFAPDKNGALIGGITPAYSSKNGRCDFKLFVGTVGFGLKWGD